jgi:MFS family permease
MMSLYLPAAILSLGTGIAAPVLPAYAKSFDVSFGTASLVLIVHAYGMLVATFPTGYLVDKLGRKPVLIAGPVITALTAFLTAFAGSFPELLVYRFVNGASAQMWAQARLAMIADTGGDRDRGKMITWMASTQRFGMLFAPAIGGLVAGWDIRLPFIIHGILVLIALVPAIKLIPETAPGGALRKQETGDWNYIFSELRRPQMLYFLAAQLFANLTRGNIQGILLLYIAYAYDKGPAALGLMSAATAAIVMPIGFLTGHIMDRYGRKMTVVPGFYGLFVSALLLAICASAGVSFEVFLVFYFMLHISQGITAGNMQVLGSDLAPSRARGRFFGIWRTIAEVGQVGSPTIFGLLAAISYAASFSFVSMCGLVVALIIGFKIHETVRREEVVAPAAEGSAESAGLTVATAEKPATT